MPARARILGAAAVALGVLVTAVAVVLAHRTVSASSSRSRVYSAVDLCLLTDSSGVGSAAGAPVWAAMQQVSLRTRAKASYLAVAGADDVPTATPYVNTLIARHCDVVLAVGTAEAGAVTARAAANPATRFLVVANGAGAVNVAVVPTGPPDRVEPAVAAVLEKAVHGDFAGGRYSSS